MKISRIVCIAILVLCFALPAAAQYVGILQSAETMERGTFKFMVAPIMVFGKDGADDEFGVAARGGYAFTEHFDVEAKLGFLRKWHVRRRGRRVLDLSGFGTGQEDRL